MKALSTYFLLDVLNDVRYTKITERVVLYADY